MLVSQLEDLPQIVQAPTDPGSFLPPLNRGLPTRSI